jgi:hypothetical protein
MDYFGYISEVYKQKLYEKTHLTNHEFEFFYQNIARWEVDNGPFSVYQIYTNIKDRGENMAYKNVHQKLQKLYSFGLLEGSEYNGRSIHGAKFYRVSSKGWFTLIINAYLISPLSSIASTVRKAIQKYYTDNIIFSTLICPYFDPESIELLIEEKMLLDYLINCCQSTVDAILSRPSDGREISINRYISLIQSNRLALTDPTEELEESIALGIDRQVKSLIFKLVLSLSKHPKEKYSYFSMLASQLSSDDKFMNILNKVENEFFTNIRQIRSPISSEIEDT